MEEEVKTVLSCTKIMVENGMIDHVMVNWHTSVNLVIKLQNSAQDLHHQVNKYINLFHFSPSRLLPLLFLKGRNRYQEI